MGSILTPIVYLKCSTSSKPTLIFPLVRPNLSDGEETDLFAAAA
jgi:hypothetical protein